MKTYFISLMTTVSFNLNSAFADSTSGFDFNRGYCVQAGRELRKENAVVTIEGNKINGRPHMSLKPEHIFFDSYAGDSELRAVNWGGAFHLKRTKNNFDGTFEASYENFLHGHQVQPHLVLCVAEEGYFENSFVAKGVARFAPWSDHDYCEGAKYIADASAHATCGMFKAKRISQYSENLGGGVHCSVEARYVCTLIPIEVNGLGRPVTEGPSPISTGKNTV